MLGRLARRLRPAVAAATELARERGVALYLAGGGARDLFLGRSMRDLDLVIEGDGIAFARDLAARLAASIHEHRRFGTAVLGISHGVTLDVASARRESYAHPGALPTIVSGVSIEEDLARRDFTVNAMALELAPGRRRIDPFGAVADLERGVIRELHSRSFLDDPTRAFRAVRYAIRLGFRVLPATRRAITAAMAGRVLAGISGDRLRRELQLILEEPQRGRAIVKLAAFGLSQAVEPALCADTRAARRVARAEALSGSVEGETTWLCYFRVWMWQASEREVERVCDRLALVGAQGRSLRRWPEVARRLAAADVANDVSNDELAAAASALPARQRRAMLEQAALRRLRLSIRGADLIAAGIPAGPGVGAALARTLSARQAGRIRDKDELAFALAAAKGQAQ